MAAFALCKPLNNAVSPLSRIVERNRPSAFGVRAAAKK